MEEEGTYGKAEQWTSAKLWMTQTTILSQPSKMEKARTDKLYNVHAHMPRFGFNHLFIIIIIELFRSMWR